VPNREAGQPERCQQETNRPDRDATTRKRQRGVAVAVGVGAAATAAVLRVSVPVAGAAVAVPSTSFAGQPFESGVSALVATEPHASAVIADPIITRRFRRGGGLRQVSESASRRGFLPPALRDPCGLARVAVAASVRPAGICQPRSDSRRPNPWRCPG
jgi:hypothetical protein